MDNSTKAEKIVNEYFNGDNGKNTSLYEKILSQLDEAVREALESKDKKAISCSHCSGTLQSFQAKWYRGCLCECHAGTYEDAYAKGFADAREKAAGIADQHTMAKGCPSNDWERAADLTARHIGEEVRAMQPEEK